MHVFKIAILFLLLFTTGCATNDEATTREVRSAVEDRCTFDNSAFDSYYDAAECTKSNPDLVLTTINAIVQAGGTCTATNRYNTCTSIEPIDDETTKRFAGWPIRCYDFFCRWTSDGKWTCTSNQPSCCLLTQPGHEECIPLSTCTT